MLIPRQFHFIFGLKKQVVPFHLAHYLCLRSCLEVNKPERIHLYFHYKPWGPLWDLIEASLSLHSIPDFSSLESLSYPELSESKAYSYAHTSDFLRVAVLNREGGVYADIDTLFIKPYPEELFEHSFVMGHEKVDPHAAAAGQIGSLCNALFFSESGSSFGQMWHAQMRDSFDGSWSRHSTFLPHELACAHPDLIHVEPESSFFCLDWSREGIRRLFERREKLPENAYSLHLWAHLWWDRTRTDVSRFHAGRLTPEYVAYSGSTYACYARRFLPEHLLRESKVAWQAKHTSDQASDLLHDVTARAVGKLKAISGRRRG